MAELVADCPRCGARRITFDIRGSHELLPRRHNWEYQFEVLAVCRQCQRTTDFVLVTRLERHEDVREVLSRKTLEQFPMDLDQCFDVTGFICPKDLASVAPPDHVPDDIATAFREGATCCNVECWNAAAAMFRLCIDLATKAKLLKKDEANIPRHKREKLGPRLKWLFANNVLPDDLEELSTCIHEDRNDGTLEKADALALRDFATALLDRIYTQPERLRLAKVWRKERRKLNK